MEWLWTLDPVLMHTVFGILLVIQIGSAAFILARTGVTPVWALVLLVPFVSIIAVWVFAFMRWPRFEGAGQRQ
jgi:hypothetical protein